MAQPGGKGEKFWEEGRGQGRVEREKKERKRGEKGQVRRWGAAPGKEVCVLLEQVGSPNPDANLSRLLP